MSTEPARPGLPDPNDSTLITYAVLTGLTPLIPVPFVDDMVKGYFRRRMVGALAERQGLKVDPATLDSLAAERGGCCMGGCLTEVFIYPLKVIFRKVFFFLEWKRAFDLTSYTYHYGYLVDHSLRQGYVPPTGAPPGRVETVRAGIEHVCREAPIKPVERAVAATFRQSRSILTSAAAQLGQSFRRVSGRPTEEKVAQAVGAVDQQEREEIRGVVEMLQARTGAIPEAHYRDLRERLRRILGEDH